MSSKIPAIAKVIIALNQLNAIAFGQGQLISAAGKEII